MELLLVLIIVVLVIWLIVLSSRSKKLKVTNNQMYEAIKSLKKENRVQKERIALLKIVKPKEDIASNETDKTKKNFYTNKAIYEDDSEKAIKMFIDDLYIRKYEKDKEKGADFERFIGAVYRLAGYEVIQNGLSSGKKKKSDGGIDVIATKDGKTTLIQCKHLRLKGTVDVGEAMKFVGARSSESDKKILVTTGKLSGEAYKEWKEEKKFIVIDQNSLFYFLNSLIPDVLNELEITKNSFEVKQLEKCLKCQSETNFFREHNAFGNIYYKCVVCEEKH